MTPFEARCVQGGLRLSEHRRIVLGVLETADDHLCMREIHRRAAAAHRIGIATVYRTINSLVELGLVKRTIFPDGKAQYEHAGRAPHLHLIDIGTGRVLEVDDAGLERLLQREAQQLGYQLVDFSLMLFARVDR